MSDADEKNEASAQAETAEPEPRPSASAEPGGGSKPSSADETNAEPASAQTPSSEAPGGSVIASDATEGWQRWAPLAIAAALPILFFFCLPPLSSSGLWDPFELNVADLARRIAVNLHGASNLVLEGADNSLPHLNDLGRPQLAFTSIALGFRYFGLHEWAGRAPLAVWGLAGVLATYAFVSRLVDRRAGVFAAVALTTMPLYFVQARTMLGDIVIMASLAMSFGGLAVAVFDRDEAGPTAPGKRAPWLLMAVVGLASGYYSRGGMIGLGVPLASIGLAWAVKRAAGASHATKSDGFGDAVALVSLGLGAGALWMGVSALGADKRADLSPWVGAMIRPNFKYPTYDYYIAHIGHALAPWSAFVPFALGRMFLPPVGRTGAIYDRESTTRMALLVGAACLFTVHGFVVARTDLLAFAGPALLAATAGIAVRDYERGAHGSVAVGVGTAVLLGVLHHDFHALPEKAYQAFAVVQTTFPESFKQKSVKLWWVALGGFAILAFLTWVERDAKRTPFDPKNYARILKALREEWDGLLALAYFAMVAGASIAGLAIYVGVRTKAKWMPTLSTQVRDGVLNAWWVTAFVPLGVILGTYFACDVWLWAFGRAGKLSMASLTRGFEPFEDLVRRLRERSADEPGESKATASAKGDTRKDGADKGDANGDRAKNDEPKADVTNAAERDKPGDAAILVPFMVLAIPGAVFYYLYSQGTRVPVALSLAIPSGVAFFLLMGLAGEVLRGSRAAFFAAGGALVGFVLCFSYYPALANQLSPKEVFESYQKVRAAGEPLALLGVGGRTAAYYAGGQPLSFNDTASAYQWLTADSSQRRFLAIKAEELPRLNQMYREHAQPRANLPVLDARSSQILLVSSRLAPGEKNESPLEKILLSAPPKPQRKIDANLEDKLLVLGFDIVDQSGRFVEVVAPGRKYHMRIYYKVLAPVTSEWEGFIHIDGYHRRHNGDHKVMQQKYPFSLWLKDDMLVDDHEFSLEPNFTPGTYTIYFGLFMGDTRMKVKSGPNDGDNRIVGGNLSVQ
jgi:hypothetical protein